MAGETKAGYLFNAQTTTGRAYVKLPSVPSMTMLMISITGSATINLEVGDDNPLFVGSPLYITVATVNVPSSVQWSIPVAILAANITAVSGSVTITYRTVNLLNMPSQTLIIYDGTTVTSPIVSTTDHGNLSGLSDDDHPQYVLATGARAMSGAIDLTGIAAGAPSAKANATSDTPVATWGAAAGNEVSAAPAGWLEVLIGGVSRYIPFWA